MKKIGLKDRIDLTIEALPRHNFRLKPAAIEAGYSPKYAHTQRTLRKAIHRRLLKYVNDDKRELDKNWDIEELSREYEYILRQRKDLSTKHKAIAPILAKYNIIPKQEDTNINIPILNIVVERKRNQILEQPSSSTD